MYENTPFEGYYAFICTDGENSIEKRQEVRTQHIARLKELQEQGRLLLAGPCLDCDDLSVPVGGLIIAQFDSLQEAQEWLQEEPYLKVGAYKEVLIRAYKDVLGLKK